MAEDLRSDRFLADPCLLTEPSKYHGHSIPGEWLLPLGTEQGISTSMSAGQPSLCCRVQLLQIRTQVGEAGWPQRHQAFFASSSPHTQRARVLVQIRHP